MSTRRIRVVSALLLGAAALAAACADSPTAPRVSTLTPGAAPNLEVVSPAVYASGVKRDVPLAENVVTSFAVDGNGGRFRLPGGLTIDVAAATFKTPITLTVTALAGDMVAYEFQPHGLVFRKPLSMKQDMRGTNWRAHDVSKLEIGYFTDSTALSMKENRALIKEFLRANIDTQGQRVIWDVHHFSGYMVSTGRQSSFTSDE
jgi:hypothetical protein